MGVLDAILHLLNFAAPGVCIGVFTASVAKLLWRRDLAGVAWRRLAAWGSGAGVATSLAGLVLFGRDGRMVTYGAMLVACALALLWSGFGPGRR